MLVEALRTHGRRAPVVEASGSWEENLRALAHRLAEFAAGPVEGAIAAIMAGGQHPEFNQTVLDLWRPAMESWHRLVHVAAERGEVAEGLDPRTVVDTLLAPIIFTPLAMRRPMDAPEVDALVDLLLSGSRAR
ncbi:MULTISPECIES: TetR-like C-terminal domain-containing protein [Dietzia]|uniref:TetR-like C-terminal domain-containing protein n=1 Tax=Dietzia TaxID=37914 RepID=UPI0009F62340|nr:TetR-like C-terminal domain-containing protein [Dietzia cinnamea]MBM7229702.1 TetR/AcrR family transcriptional regulator C-terminal ligand-binding domain-containing protein [Dietzia cinnamea]